MAAGTTPTPHHQHNHQHHSSSHSQHSAGGKVANGLSSTSMNSTHMGSGGSGGGMSSGQGGGLGFGEDGDNRTRNAKAQRRHREKRKAHLKALEDSVSVLTAQLEDARRQLGQAAYFSQSGQRQPGAPLSPQSKDFGQLQAENSYLRDENADLRRQLYSYRSAYGHPPPVNPDAQKDGAWGDVKAEQGGFVYPSGSGGVSPRRGMNRGSGGDLGPTNNSLPSTAEGSSSAHSSGNSSYPPPIDHFTPIHQRPRSRVMSSSSAPSASPYMPSDPRTMDARYPPPPPGVRYEASPSMYPAPPPHSVPRYDVPHSYTPRQPDHSGSGSGGGDNVPQWPPEQIPGPPPFSPYPMGYSHDSGAH